MTTLFRSTSSWLSMAMIGFGLVIGAHMMPINTAQAATIAAPSKPLYPWKTESATDEKSGAMQHCLVKNAFENGTLLLLAENYDGLQRLAIHFPEDVLQQGILVDLALQVDKQDVFPVEGMTSSTRVLAMNVPDAFAEQLRKGNVLYIRGPEDEIAYQLHGTDKAVQALRDCVTSHKNPSLTRKKLAAISDADADILAHKPIGRSVPKEMMEPLQAPVSAAEMQKNLGLDLADMHLSANDTAKEANKTPVKGNEKAADKMPVVPVPKIKEAPLPLAAKDHKTAPKYQDGVLPSQWHYIFNHLAVAPKGKTVSAQKMGMTAPLQYAWAAGDLKIGLHTGNGLNKAGLAQSAKHYMFNLRQDCKGEFVAEADDVKISTRGVYWQVAEIVCAAGKNETLFALLFTASNKESSTVVIQGDMKDAARIIRFRNDVLEYLNR